MTMPTKAVLIDSAVASLTFMVPAATLSTLRTSQGLPPTPQRPTISCLV
jgi:hypothetical protein